MSVSFKDYYALLGVQRDATQDAIHKAYRQLARKHHPDVDKTAGATKRFQDLQEAHEVLSDPAKRARYDQLGANWKDGQEFTPPPGFQGARSGRGRRATSADFDFQDLAGFSDFFSTIFGEHARQQAARGQTFQHAGFEEHELHSDADLRARLDIAPWEAALGGKVPFGLDGKEVLLTIPAGSPSGRELRLRGLGRPRRDGTHGDLYVELRIVVPEAKDDAQRKLWSELAKLSRFDPRA